MEVSELRELRPLRDENRRLKQVVVDRSLNKTILQASWRKKDRAGGSPRVDSVGAERVPDTVDELPLVLGVQAA